MTPPRKASINAVVHNRPNGTPSLEHRPFSDRNRLAPEDAFYAHSPPRLQRDRSTVSGSIDGSVADEDEGITRKGGTIRRRRSKVRGRSKSQRRVKEWKKLLWWKQPYPDNYTDAPTFLSHLQRNPRLLPYDFWPLVADSTVIVQHLCSVAIFICCFVGIYEERVSPVSVVSWGSAGTVLGWFLWDLWLGQEEAAKPHLESAKNYNSEGDFIEEGGSIGSTFNNGNGTPHGSVRSAKGLGLSLSEANLAASQIQSQSRRTSATSLKTTPSAESPELPTHSISPSQFPSYYYYPPYNAPASAFSPRMQQRLATAKSAVLITCGLMGLSPILESLTKSTSSDSIWALSCWLMCINVFFFDYGGGVGVKFPASLSTNAALMSSTVLASRLPSTTHVFSLTLFSIEVFGLFPVFRRLLRRHSWRLHVFLTVFLIIASGAGMGLTLVDDGKWGAAIAGIVLWGGGMVLGMGGCSWWLIGLQKYKNVVIGPWDTARPVLRGRVGWEGNM